MLLNILTILTAWVIFWMFLTDLSRRPMSFRLAIPLCCWHCAVLPQYGTHCYLTVLWTVQNLLWFRFDSTGSRPFMVNFSKIKLYKILPFCCWSSNVSQKVGLSFFIFLSFLYFCMVPVFHFIINTDPHSVPKPKSIPIPVSRRQKAAVRFDNTAI
jgi:hypothetical protein